MMMLQIGVAASVLGGAAYLLRQHNGSVRHTIGSTRGDGGGHALEAAILTPVLLLLLGILVAAGRVSSADGKADAAAASAARAASQQADAASAQAAAETQAAQDFRGQGVSCLPLNVIVDTAAFSLPPGQPGSVTVTVSCTVSLSDVAIPGLPGSTTLDGSAASSIDIYQEDGGVTP